MATPTTVDEYLAGLSDERRSGVEQTAEDDQCRRA